MIHFDDRCNASYKFEDFMGFNKYRVSYAINDDVYFSVVNPKKRKKANYMIRYYYTGLGRKDKYTVNLNPEIDINYLNNEYASVTLTFEPIQVKFNYDVSNINIYFYIYGFLFNLNENLDELINTTCMLTEQVPEFQNKTKHAYSINNPQKWSLIFANVPRTKNYVYDLQLQVNSIIENNIFNEEFLIFTTKINLTEIIFEEPENYTWIIVGCVLGFIVLLLIVFFIIKYIKLNRRNKNLKEDLKSMAYSNDIQKNVLVKAQQTSQKESDYDTTFI